MVPSPNLLMRGPAAWKPAAIWRAMTSNDGSLLQCPGASASKGCCAVEYTVGDYNQAATPAAGCAGGKEGAICCGWAATMGGLPQTGAATPTPVAVAGGSSSKYGLICTAPPLRQRMNARAKHKNVFKQ